MADPQASKHNTSPLSINQISSERTLTGQSQLWDRPDLDTSMFTHFEKSSPQPDIKLYLEFRFNLRSFLLDFQSFSEKPVYACAFAHSLM